MEKRLSHILKPFINELIQLPEILIRFLLKKQIKKDLDQIWKAVIAAYRTGEESHAYLKKERLILKEEIANLKMMIPMHWMPMNI